MIKRFTIAFCVILGSLAAKAQQDPYYNHFMLNRVAYNPGAAGFKNAICVNVLAHRQWLGLDNSGELEYQVGGQTLERRAVGPQTYFASITAPIFKKRFGASLVLMNDAVGYERTIGFKGGIAYHIKVEGGKRFQIGLDAGMLQKEFDGRYYNPRQPNDPLIPTNQQSGRIFDLGAGMYYSNPKALGLELGLSSTHLLGGKVNYEVAGITRTVNIVRNIYASASMAFPIGGGNIVLQPNIWVKTIFTTTQVDLNCRALFSQKFIAGLAYRDGGNTKYLDALTLQLGYYINQNFYLGYGYDIPTTKGLARGGTHEIIATYCFRLPQSQPDPPSWLIDPRHLGGYR